MKVTVVCISALLFDASRLVVLKDWQIQFWSLYFSILEAAFAQAWELGFLIKPAINYSSLELIKSKLVAF